MEAFLFPPSRKAVEEATDPELRGITVYVAQDCTGMKNEPLLAASLGTVPSLTSRWKSQTKTQCSARLDVAAARRGVGSSCPHFD